MINKLPILLLLGLFFSQGLNFNLESKYGNGTNVNEFTQDEEDYNYFENILDINFSYNNLFFYTQLEYSNSPIYGLDKTMIKDLANSYVLDYSGSSLTLKYGHIQTLYGYGLALNAFQDQITDFDNRAKGVEFKYSPNDIMDIFYVTGSGKYGMKSSGDKRYNDLLFNHELDFYGAQFYTSFGDFIVSNAKNKTYYAAGMLNDVSINRPFLGSDTRLSDDLESFQVESFSNFNELANSDSEVNLSSLNIGYSNTLGVFDICYEKSINRYNKILRENDMEDGYYDYFSLASNIFEIDFLYEFKDYNMLYYMPISSNPPLGFMETTSILMSRNQHAINFSDEIGHQLEGRFTLFSDISFLVNLSMGMKHYGVQYQEFDFDTFEIIEGTYSKVNWNDVIDMNFLNKDLVFHKPFRNFYAEASGWSSSNKFYYKFGYGSQYSYDNNSGKNNQSFTIPAQFVYGFDNNNSLTIYYEYQKLNSLSIINSSDWNDYYTSKEYDNNYLSLSYSISNFGSLTYFYDEESLDEFSSDSFLRNKTNKWTGFDISFKISDSSQLSIFKGSQKGGLVCANGICAVQPSFENGTKITFRTLF